MHTIGNYWILAGCPRSFVSPPLTSSRVLFFWPPASGSDVLSLKKRCLFCLRVRLYLPRSPVLFVFSVSSGRSYNITAFMRMIGNDCCFSLSLSFFFFLSLVCSQNQSVTGTESPRSLLPGGFFRFMALIYELSVPCAWLPRLVLCVQNGTYFRLAVYLSVQLCYVC